MHALKLMLRSCARGAAAKGPWGARGALALVLGFLLVGCVEVARIPPAPVPEGAVRGVLALDNALSVSLDGATVRTEDERLSVGPDGVFALRRVTPGKHHLVVEKRFEQGPVRRVLGVAVFYFADLPISLRIPVRDATDVDRFCTECHPQKGAPVRRGQVIRDVHPSGVVPRKAVGAAGRFDERGRVTCESCHTVHESVGFPKFTRASYLDGKLCVECHV